ncbi:MAG: phosphatidate cytidylyltransferase [Porticoccus sp.]
MLKQRVITAIVIAVVFLLALFSLSPYSFSLAVAVVVIYAAWEWSDLSGISGHPLRLAYTAVLAVLLAVVAYILGLTTEGSIQLAPGRSLLMTMVPWWAIALLWVQGYPSSAILWGSCWVRGIMGFLVLVPTWSALVILIHSAQGQWMILLVVMIVALADIGAYFSGRHFGKHKLAPSVSPNKTWEGLLGGVVANVVVVLLLGAILKLDSRTWGLLAVMIMITALASVLGDLLESMVKRHRGIKDSGNILPGHGGVLDRVDSLTAALPVFTLIYIYSGIQF